jgi:hypothetical protein
VENKMLSEKKKDCFGGARKKVLNLNECGDTQTHTKDRVLYVIASFGINPLYLKEPGWVTKGRKAMHF